MESKGVKIAISVGCLVFGLIILVISIFFSGSLQQNQIDYIRGEFSIYYEENYPSSRGAETVRYICLANGSSYSIGSVTYEAFDKDVFLSNVKKGDLIELIVEKSKKNNSAVVAIYKGGIEYMNYEDTQKSMQTNQIIGMFLGIISIITGIIALHIALQ